MHKHHKNALRVIAATGVLVVVLGTLMGLAEHCGPLHGIYCTTGFATTAGCDLQLHGWRAYTLGELSMILMIPLWTGMFSYFTAGLAGNGLIASERRIKRHVNGALRHHLSKGVTLDPPK